MSKVRLIITSIISIVLVSILLIGSTYSIFTTTEIDEELNVYKTGDLNINYASNNVKITDVTPMTIEEADSVIPHRITVTNNGNVPYMFDLILTDTTSSDSNTIDYQYIMTKVGYLEPKSLSNCTNNIIKEDIILLPGEVVDIDVRVWLSDNIKNSEMGKSFYAKLSIDGQAVYNDNTEIDNSKLSLRMMKSIGGAYSQLFFHNSLYSDYIRQVSFVDYIDINNASTNTETSEKIMWDMSTSNDKSVIAWLEDNGDFDENGNKYYNLYIGANEKIYASSLAYYFHDMNNIETITFNNLDTSLTISMNSIFRKCSSLISLNLSSFDTSKLTNMSNIFESCENLTELDLSIFDTSKVTNMTRMFFNCNHLTELDISNFDTRNVTVMNEMFYGCALKKLDLSSFDFFNVTSMYGMFAFCGNLASLDLGKFNAPKLTSMHYVFQNCRSLTSLDLSNFDTSNITNMKQTFQNCSSLENLYLNNADFSNVTDYNYMLANVPSTTNIYVKDEIQANWITEKYNNLTNIIY